jgi:hypothetical protein
MISAFLGTSVALERAVALQQRWMYTGPLLSGLGGLALLLGFGNLAGATLIALGGLVFIAMMVVIVRRKEPPQRSSFTPGARYYPGAPKQPQDGPGKSDW